MMHCHSGFGRVIGFIVSLLLCLAAIIIGLHAFNINLFETGFFKTHLPMLLMPLQIAFGVAGLLGLFYLLTSQGNCCKQCDARSPHNRNM